MKLTDYRDKIKLEKVRYNPNNKLLTFYIGEQKFSYSIVYIFLSELREYYKQRLRDSEGDIDKYLSLCSDACQSFNFYSDFLSVYVDIDSKRYSEYFLNQLECLKHRRDFIKEQQGKNILENKGFNTNLSDEKIECLYKKIVPKYFDTDLSNFKAFLNGGYLTEKVKYVLQNPKGEPHKKVLREFFELLKTNPTQRILKKVVCDKEGTTIELSKPKKNEPSNYLEDLERIFEFCK